MTQAQEAAVSGNTLLPLPRLAGPARARKGSAGAERCAGCLPLEQVSNLLWAGFGLSCHGSGGRAAVPSRGWREVDVYVCLADGSYRYDARDHALILVAPNDLRRLAGRHGSAPAPALALVYVTDGPAEEDDAWEETGRIAGADASCIAGNVATYSAAAGFAARSESRCDPQLAAALGLRAPRRIALTQTVTAPPVH